MADKARRVDYYYLEVPDTPGEALRILSGLKESRVNLLAFCGFPLGSGKSQIDLVAEDAAALRQAADRQGLKLSAKKQAFLVQGDDRVGAVAETLGALGRQGINIVGSQAVSAGSGRWGMILWVKAADYERAAKALGA